MRKLLCLVPVIVLFSLLAASPADAQVRLGGSVGYGLDAERVVLALDTWFGLGQLGESSAMHLNPSLGGYLIPDVAFIRFDLNLPFSFELEPELLALYVGPGLSLAYKKVDLGSSGSSDGYDVALNAMAGMLLLPNAVVNPNLQLRLTLGDWVSRLELLAGVMARF